jgi:hypothetical protein
MRRNQSIRTSRGRHGSLGAKHHVTCGMLREAAAVPCTHNLYDLFALSLGGAPPCVSSNTLVQRAIETLHRHYSEIYFQNTSYTLDHGTFAPPARVIHTQSCAQRRSSRDLFVPSEHRLTACKVHPHDNRTSLPEKWHMRHAKLDSSMVAVPTTTTVFVHRCCALFLSFISMVGSWR